ncbi:MAG: glycosyltransferase family 2 protein [Smithella sp.]|nr:glycosyltransferase family 2 protein [Smithella sp.]
MGYYVLIDADSKNNPNLLKNINSVITEKMEIYQQPLAWFKNFGSIKSWLMTAFSFNQTFFSIAYEIPMFIGKFFPYRLKYLVGHGLCLKGSFLESIGGFPAIIEDVRIGRLSSLINKPVGLIPSFGNVETAKNFSIYIKQSSVWFFGCGLFMEDLKYLNKSNLNKTPFRNFLLALYGFGKASRWLNKGLLHLLGISVALIINDWIMLSIFLSSLFVCSVIPPLLVYKNLDLIIDKNRKEIKTSKISKAVLFSPVTYCFNFLGLYLGLYRLIKFYLWKSYHLPKTER